MASDHDDGANATANSNGRPPNYISCEKTPSERVIWLRRTTLTKRFENLLHELSAWNALSIIQTKKTNGAYALSISDQQFFDAIDKLKSVRSRLKQCKAEQTEEIAAACADGKEASRVLDQYFVEEWERRTGKPYPQH